MAPPSRSPFAAVVRYLDALLERDGIPAIRYPAFAASGCEPVLARVKMSSPESLRPRASVPRSWGALPAAPLVAYIDAGERLFVDERFRRHVPAQLRERGGDALFFYDGEHGELRQGVNMQFTLMALHALDRVPLQGAHVLDLGCADGILEMAMCRCGAERVIGVDRNAGALAAARRQLGANGIPQHRVALHERDITDPRFAGTIPLERIGIVVANIGKGQYPGAPDEAAIALLAALPHARHFVASGYGEEERHSPAQALAALARQGYRIAEWIETTEPGERKKYAFVAQRAA